MQIRFLLAACAAALLVLGCRTPQVAVYPIADLADRTPSERVDVYAHPDSLPRPHRQLAVLSATASGGAYAEPDSTRLLNALADRAKALGADAIAVFRRSDNVRFEDERLVWEPETERPGTDFTGGGPQVDHPLPYAMRQIRVIAVAYAE